MPTNDSLFNHDNPAARIAENAWKHAAEHNKQKWNEAEQRCAEANIKLSEFQEIEGRLDPWTNEGPLRLRRTLKESLLLLAEVFVNKYPKEDADVVQKLVAMFVEPIERSLVGDEQSNMPSKG
jgi:hypothetical protein